MINIKSKIIQKNFVIAILYVFFIATGTLCAEQNNLMKKWHLIVSPLAGILDNSITFHYDLPTNKNEITPREKTLEDTGLGYGLTTVLHYKTFVALNVFFFIPNVNSSTIIGDVFSINWSAPLFKSIMPSFGLIFVYNRINSVFHDFTDTITKDGATGTGFFKLFEIKNNVFTILPRIGAKIKIPIQHWYIKPYVGYLGEFLSIHVNSPGGVAHVEAPTYSFDKQIPTIQSDKQLTYHNFITGLQLFIDFHYAIQLHSNFYYNITRNLWTWRSVLAAFFSRKIPIGITSYFEWSHGITHSNLFLFAGLAWMF